MCEFSPPKKQREGGQQPYSSSEAVEMRVIGVWSLQKLDNYINAYLRCS